MQETVLSHLNPKKDLSLGLKQTQYIRFCGHYQRNQQETQSIRIHEVLQGLAKHYGAISNTVSFLRVFRCDRIF